MRLDPGKLRSIGVLHEDDALLVVTKPAGMAVHGGAGETGRTVVDLLEAAYTPRAALHLVHRLDKATSGVLLVAKSREVARALAASWDRAEKVYAVVVRGVYAGPARLTQPLPDEDGVLRDAITRVETVAVLSALEPAVTLMLARIESGRTHQIRRHLASAGHPVMLDDKHGDFSANKAWVRAVKDAGARAPHKADLLLHALQLGLRGPPPRRWTAPLPSMWAEALGAAGAVAETLAALPERAAAGGPP